MINVIKRLFFLLSDKQTFCIIKKTMGFLHKMYYIMWLMHDELPLNCDYEIGQLCHSL